MNPKDIDHLRAFPQQEWDFDQQEYLSHGGMELRDHFAGMAMQGFVSTLTGVNFEPKWSVLATDAYTMADAMMKARKL